MWARGSAAFLAVAGAVLVAELGASLYYHLLAGILVAIVLFAIWGFLLVFFRDPERRAVGEGVLSAADGRVRAVEREGEFWRISVFMNVTDVHVNRFPLDAAVASVSDAGQGHRPAYRADAAHNQQRTYQLETAAGRVELVQMTGILARRLVSFVRPGERHARGDRLGMIVLGSRVDLLLPAGTCEPTVTVGTSVRAGETPVARVRQA